MKRSTINVAITLRPDIHAQGKRDADALGLSFSAYIALLITTASPEKLSPTKEK